MAGVNKVILLGRLTRDPELSQLESGTTIVKFGVATSEKYKDKEDVEFHNVVAFGKTGQVIEQHFNKGDQIYIEGKNKTSKWEKDNNKFQRTEVIASRFDFIGSKSESNQESSQCPDGEPPF